MEETKSTEVKVKKGVGTDLNQFTVQIQKVKNSVGRSVFQLGHLLKTVKENEIFKQQCETFDEYLGTPEISLSRGYASKVIKIYEVFKDKTFEEYPDTEKLYLITDVIEKYKNDEKVQEEFIQASFTLSRSDLMDLVREKLGKTPKHSITYEERVDQYLDETQIDDLVPSNKKDGWEDKFAKNILIDFKKWSQS